MARTEDEEQEMGPLLRRLRGEMSMREVHRLTGISSGYISQIENGNGHPGPRVLKRLAGIYGVGVQDLLKWAGHLNPGEEEVDQVQDVERAYQYVLADSRFRFGTRPRGPLTLESKRFIVEMYEKLTGRRLLE